MYNINEVKKLKDSVSGVYCIENRLSNKKYVGLSIDVYKRWKTHIRDLNKNKHHSYKLQNEWDCDNFIFYILEECVQSDLEKLEIKYIKKLDTYNNGYNNTTGGYTYPKLLETHILDTNNSIKNHFNKYNAEYKLESSFKEDDIAGILKDCKNKHIIKTRRKDKNINNTTYKKHLGFINFCNYLIKEFGDEYYISASLYNFNKFPQVIFFKENDIKFYLDATKISKTTDLIKTFNEIYYGNRLSVVNSFSVCDLRMMYKQGYIVEKDGYLRVEKEYSGCLRGLYYIIKCSNIRKEDLIDFE